MAWHEFGGSFYSSEERRAYANGWVQIIVDLGLPSAATYLAVNALIFLIGSTPFFLLHTTTAKLIYIVAGLFTFVLAYVLRHIIISIAFLCIAGAIAFIFLADFYHWLMK